MPLFRFRCNPCDRDEKKLMSKEKADGFSGACSLCGNPLSQVIGIPEAQEMVTADDYRGKSVIANIENKLDRRAQDHFNKHDLPRLIADQGKEWCQQQGFLDADGKPK